MSGWNAAGALFLLVFGAATLRPSMGWSAGPMFFGALGVGFTIYDWWWLP